MAHYLIIGGTRGIGAAIVQHLLALDHHVSIWARNPPAAPLGERAQFFYNNPAEQIPNITGLPEVLDGLVYCPGSIHLKPFARTSIEDFNQDFAVNVLGAVRSLQAVTPLLKKSPQASVVLFSSVAAAVGMAFHASIASSKAAIEGLVRSLACEWAPAIRVNGIAPSLTHTSLTEKLLNTAEKITAAEKRHPLQKIATAEEIAALAVFLLSPQAGFITGQIMAADGGLSRLINPAAK
ncbi:MAG TPA: SDR family oxidoreductase [Cellvibrionaceae bacterium]|nr:SDR family oxidoreductase [Cellvibrionaceae bacterium]HMY40751.1 SDR family oxidoreductase [Marinagarivorans sp.]HNG61883.1 SDR family oxidoreductase [Cellvibrionaceae bacterium]